MALLFYQLFVWLYKAGAFCLSPFNQKARNWYLGRKGLLNKLENSFKNNNEQRIWFHCASLGEFEQGRPLLEAIRKKYPGYKILLTFFSPSGYEIRKNYEGADYVFYLPMDTPAHARKLLEIVKPRLVVWIKYEYWYYYLKQIHKNQIPLLLVSGIFRQGQPFFKWYGQLYRAMLSCFSYCFVQNELSKHLLESIGYHKNVFVNGDTRFDRVIEIAAGFEPVPQVAEFVGTAKTIVAGSTWEEDEEVLDHFANTHPEIKFILAPHEIDEDHLLEIEKLFKSSIRYSALIRTEGDPAGSTAATQGMPGTAANVLIFDNIGMLARLYHYASICFIGGGFGEDGVHNVLEAAVYGKPVVFGPVYEKYAEAVGLADAGSAFSIENALELEDLLLDLLQEGSAYAVAAKASHDYVYANKGATEKILEYIQENRLLTN